MHGPVHGTQTGARARAPTRIQSAPLMRSALGAVAGAQLLPRRRRRCRRARDYTERGKV